MTQAAVSGAIPSSSVWGAAKSSPLWTLEWPINPETLPAGLHKIGITVLDSKGRCVLWVSIRTLVWFQLRTASFFAVS